MPLGQVPQSVEPAPNLGSQPVLVIFVDFSPSVRVGSTGSILNAKFFGVGSSVKDYYEEVSYGNFSISPAPETDTLLGGDVNDGVVSVVLNYAHPNTGGTIDIRNQNITRDALIAADSFVNFAQFDTNGDGTISPTQTPHRVHRRRLRKILCLLAMWCKCVGPSLGSFFPVLFSMAKRSEHRIRNSVNGTARRRLLQGTQRQSGSWCMSWDMISSYRISTILMEAHKG